MSYDNTVRCGFCHDKGHNKRSCEAFKLQVETWSASDDPYYQRRAARVKQRLTGRIRACSWCHETGHTIRKCDSFNTLVDNEARSCLEARKLIVRRIHKHNFGVGSLVQYSALRYERGGYINVTYLAVVTAIHYHTITDRNLSDYANFHKAMPVEAHAVTGPSIGHRRLQRLPRCIIDVGRSSAGACYQGRYDEKIGQAVVLNGSTPDVPDDVFDWKTIRQGAYKYLKQ